MKFSIIQTRTLALCCLATALFTSTTGHAQAPQSPADCKAGCTSNDVQIIRAFLVNPTTGAEIGSNFPCSGTATVKLGLELATKTPRVGVEVYANIKNFTGGVIGNLITNTKQCFSVVLDQPTNRVVFQSTFSWTCGMPIALTDVFLGWGTGNTDFCQANAAFRCPGTPSKCYQLPPGQYIPIIIPSANTASATLCANPSGGTTATFDLTTLESTVKGTQTNVTVSWFSDAALTLGISTSYNTGNSTVYAKVKNNTDTTVYSSSAVTLTVTSSPDKPTICAVQPSLCGPAKGSISVLSPTGTGYEYSIDSGSTWQSTTDFLNLAAGSNPTILAKLGGCISDTARCGDATNCSTARINSSSVPLKPKVLKSITPRAPAGAKELQVTAYPNPFSNSVNFNFSTPVAGKVLLEVYDMSGRRISVKDYGFAEAGSSRTVTLTTKKTLNSLLIYRLTVGRKSVNGRLLQKD
jgi:hypothetical protein